MVLLHDDDVDHPFNQIGHDHSHGHEHANDRGKEHVHDSKEYPQFEECKQLKDKYKIVPGTCNPSSLFSLLR